MQKLFAGARIRRLREELLMRQAELARAVGVSPSYLNQIEHDRRPLSAAVLIRLTDVLGVDVEAFASDQEARVLADLHEATTDALGGEGVPADELRELASSLPSVSRALLTLHRRYRSAVEQASALAGDGSPTPYEEVRDFFYDLDNYVADLDVAAERLAAEEGVRPGRARSPLIERLARRHGIEVRELELGAAPGVLRRLDPAQRVLFVSRELRPTQQAFQVATQLAFLELAELLSELTPLPLFSGSEARALARIGLANYFAGAVVMPYASFRTAAEELHFDVEGLCSVFDVGFESACHRLSTLQRPGARGVPFAFVRVDRAGNMSKRQSASSFHFSRIGGTCPLWSVYEAFTAPGRVQRQVAEMPDGRRYFWIAKTVQSGGQGYARPGKTFAVGLGCDLRHAHRLVYSAGLDLSDGEAATPIGLGCKVCDRPSCTQRALPAVGRPIVVDETSARLAPYAVVGPR